ncbi:MAG: hypothetical protein ABI672_04885 [Vicinamibacteria bacterium]
MLIRPTRLESFGRVLFGISISAFGVMQFAYGDFIPGRAPAWPEALPGRLAWSVTSGVIFVFAGVALALGRNARWPAAATGVLIAGWALGRRLPLLMANPTGFVLTLTGKALALSGGALSMGGSALAPLGRLCLGAFMVLGGVQHFIYPTFVATLIPRWIPSPVFWTYFAGLALVAGGLGMQVRRTRALASFFSGVMLLSWVFMLHIPRAWAAATSADGRNEWTSVFEALAFAGVAFFASGTSEAADQDA